MILEKQQLIYDPELGFYNQLVLASNNHLIRYSFDPALRLLITNPVCMIHMFILQDLDSPDVISTSTQEDRSAYQALLDPYTGSVALRHTPAPHKSPGTQRRKIQLVSGYPIHHVGVVRRRKTALLRGGKLQTNYTNLPGQRDIVVRYRRT